MFHCWFSELRGQMLELLVSGELCSAGIIDNRSIDAALTGSGWEREVVQLRVTEMVALELWMRSQRNLAS